MADAHDKTVKLNGMIAIEKESEMSRLPEDGHRELPSQDLQSDFHPIKIEGEPLSATVLRERR